MSRMARVSPCLRGEVFSHMPEIVALVGPTGSGKTSAVARAGRALGRRDRQLRFAAGLSRARHRQRQADGGGARGARRTTCSTSSSPIERFDCGARTRRWRARRSTTIGGRGRRVVVVGGTGLYLKALRFGLFAGPPARRGAARAAGRRGAARRRERCTRVWRAPIRPPAARSARRAIACASCAPSKCSSSPAVRSAPGRPSTASSAARCRCASSALDGCRARRSTRASTRAARRWWRPACSTRFARLWAARLRAGAARAAQHRLPRDRRAPARRARPRDGARRHAARDAPVRQAAAHLVSRRRDGAVELAMPSDSSRRHG